MELERRGERRRELEETEERLSNQTILRLVWVVRVVFGVWSLVWTVKMSSVVLMLDRYAMVKSRPRRFSTAICMYYLCAASVGMSYSVCRKVDAEGNVYKMIIIITGNITVNDSTNRRSNGPTKLEAKQKTKVREMRKKKTFPSIPVCSKNTPYEREKELQSSVAGSGWRMEN